MNLEFTNRFEGLDSQSATGDFGLLEQVLRCDRKDGHRFLLLCLSVLIENVDVFDNLESVRQL